MEDSHLIVYSLYERYEGLAGLVILKQRQMKGWWNIGALEASASNI